MGTGWDQTRDPCPLDLQSDTHLQSDTLLAALGGPVVGLSFNQLTFCDDSFHTDHVTQKPGCECSR